MVAKPSAIPSAITTHEQFLVWAIMAGVEAFPIQAYTERPGLVSWACEYQEIKSPGDGQLIVGRFVLPLNPASELASGAKPWLQVAEVPQGVIIPAYYASN